MSPFGRSIGGGRRQSSCILAPMLAQISTFDDDRRVALLDVSRRGAHLAAPDLPAEGAAIVLRADSLQAFGRVVWSREGQCGILFEPPIAASEVAHFRSREVKIAA